MLTELPKQLSLFDIDCGAVLSSDRCYRYSLWRIWNRRRGLVLWVGLNPSTAEKILKMLPGVKCLGRTLRGNPRHPSRLGYNTELVALEK